jgi:hypothetical protein
MRAVADGSRDCPPLITADRLAPTNPIGQYVRMFDEREAASAALRWIGDNWRPTWEPVAVRVEDVGVYWRVFYSSGARVATRVDRDTPPGNLPVLVRKSDGVVTKDLSLLRAGHPKRS